MVSPSAAAFPPTEVRRLEVHLTPTDVRGAHEKQDPTG